VRLTCFPSDSSFTSDRLMGDPSSAQLPVMIAKVSIHTSTRSLTLPSVDIFKYYLSSQYDVSPNKTSSEMLSESEGGEQAGGLVPRPTTCTWLQDPLRQKLPSSPLILVPNRACFHSFSIQFV
jgi:hypothetical protein